MTKVSVILNCYNGEKYLSQAIDSVISQSYTNWEIIFFDNCSDDNSKYIFEKFSDVRLKYFSSSKNISLASARNIALSKCSGEFITFLDVDDVWYPEKLEKQLDLFNDKSVGMSCTSYVKINERQNSIEEYIVPPIINKKVTNQLIRDYFVHISTFMFRTSLLKKFVLSFDDRFSIIEDFDFVLKMSLYTKFSSSRDVLASYRWHNNNLGLISNYKIGEEFKIWINNSRNKILFSSFKDFYILEDRAKWYEVVKDMYDGKKLSLLKNFSSFKALQRIKIIIAIFTPTNILKKLILRK
jgi:glycosyltransferase involved in cell wall biosynthesis